MSETIPSEIKEKIIAYAEDNNISTKPIEYGYLLASKTIDEAKQKCDSDHVSIDDLLSEFNRRGFNTDNWDGDAEAPEAIVSGVKTHIDELLEQQASTIAALQKENNDLKMDNMTHEYNQAEAERTWPQFKQQIIDEWKTENNL